MFELLLKQQSNNQWNRRPESLALQSALIGNEPSISQDMLNSNSSRKLKVNHCQQAIARRG